MSDLTVFEKMKQSTYELIKVIKTEISVDCCKPFAVRAYDALNELQLKTQAEAKRAANIFLDNLQTLYQGGVITEDYDMIDFVKRSKSITVSARVQALIRAFRRKGFTVIDTVIAVPAGEDIYFEEVYKDGVGIIYLLKDKRTNPDREITAERLVSGYFNKFICRLEIKDLKSNRSIMTCTEITNKEMMTIQSSSERGIFESEWIEVGDEKYSKKKKVIYNGVDGMDIRYNKDSFWVKYTAEMVRKSIMRKALKNIKEAIPELQDTCMAFDTEYMDPPEETVTPVVKELTVAGVNTLKVDLNNLTEEQKVDANEIFEIYCSNPAMAKKDAEDIKALYESGTPIVEIINEHYAELANLKRSSSLKPLIEPILQGELYEKDKN